MSERELFGLAAQALHKLKIEIQRGTAQSRAEYEWAFERLDEMKALSKRPDSSRANPGAQ